MAQEARDFVGYGKDVPRIEWPDRARVAVTFVVNFEEGSERSPHDGDPTSEPIGEGFLVPYGKRDIRNESAFEYGSRVGIWRLLDLFDRYGVKITFFICAKALEQNPIAAREITARGHEPAGHGYQWIPSYTLGREEERRQLHLAVRTIEKFTGERPRCWFARGASPHTRELVVEEGGFLYDCNAYNDDLPYFTMVQGRKWLTVPYSLENNDNKMFRSPGCSEPEDFFRVLKDGFDCLYEEGATAPKMMSIGLHMRICGRPARGAAVEKFIRYAKGFPGVWFARRIDIARWWLEKYSHLPAQPLTAP